MSDSINEAPAVKAKTEYNNVTMEDGHIVAFPGKRQMAREITRENSGHVSVRFDFTNGKSLSISSADLTPEVASAVFGNGLSQKVGDETAGVKEVEDMYLAAEAMVERLKNGDWSKGRVAGDGFSGASVVIQAICEVKGKTVEVVKAFLAKKLEDAKARGEKLTRNELYNSFRNPESATGAVIERLEREKRTKSTKVSATELLSEMDA